MSEPWTDVTPAAAAFPERVASHPSRTLAAFDFDGTLARITPHPEDATMVEESASALARLAAEGVQVAIISGRPVESIVRLSRAADRPGLASAILLGQYGAERLDMATGRASVPTPPLGIASAKAALLQVAAAYPGSHVEDKGLAVALHVRNAAEPDAAFSEVEDAMRDTASRYGLTVEPGRYVWELRGASVTKGDALAALVDEVDPLEVLFAGDDLGDIAAFDALGQIAARRGTCAVVSGSPEAPEVAARADVLCDGPDGVAAWLTALADTVAGGAQGAV